MSRLAAIAMGIALSAPAAFGQSGISMSSPQSAPMMPSPQVGGRGTIGISGPPAGGRFFGGRGHGRRFGHSGSVLLYGAPYFYPDYYYQPYEEEAPAPPPAPTPTPAVKNEPLPDPVLLELRGDRWVRVTEFETGAPAAPAPIQRNAAHKAVVAKEVPPAILVFRDGHTEDVNSYSIIDGAIYTKADYWTEGTWSRKIEIADLDIPATLEQNRQRGVKFELPSGPDEVMIRP